MAKYLPANDRFRFFDTFWTFLVVFGNNIMMEVRLFVFMLVRNLFLEMLSCMNLTSRKNLVMKTRTFIFVMHLMHFDISLEEDFCLYLKGCVNMGGGASARICISLFALLENSTGCVNETAIWPVHWYRFLIFNFQSNVFLWSELKKEWMCIVLIFFIMCQYHFLI